jgi:hypothetical protein
MTPAAAARFVTASTCAASRHTSGYESVTMAAYLVSTYSGCHSSLQCADSAVMTSASGNTCSSGSSG